MPMRPFFGIEPALLDKKVKGIEVPCAFFRGETADRNNLIIIKRNLLVN
jgi:hypothetical protein